MSAEFAKPMSVQFKPKVWAQWLVKLMGWKFEFDGLPVEQGVVIGYPHTSNWDFITLMPMKWAIGIPVQFFAKASLFRIPLFGRWMRAMGGLPIDRTSPQGAVALMAGTLSQYKRDGRFFWVLLAPEGTRKRTYGWRSGFYQLAMTADVPVGMLRIDYATKLVKLTDFMRLTGDVAADYAHISKVYEGVQGLRPNQASPIRPLPSRSTSSPEAQATLNVNTKP